MVTLGRRPRYRVVLGEVDADDVAAADRDAVSRVQREPAVTDPQRHRHRLADESVPILLRSYLSDVNANSLSYLYV